MTENFSTKNEFKYFSNGKKYEPTVGTEELQLSKTSQQSGSDLVSFTTETYLEDTEDRTSETLQAQVC